MQTADESKEKDNRIPILELRHVSHTYQARKNEIEAVRDVSIAVYPQEFLCILGPSGCGKSTLLGLLAGFFQPAEGEALMEGEPISGPDRDRGVVFQSETLYPWMNVRDNVTFGPRMLGKSREVCRAISDRYLKEMNLTAFADTKTYELSGGMKQRVALARVLANEPRVILMDEPLGSLDAVTRIQMQGLIRSIWNHEKRTIVMITHDIDEALSLGTRLLVMSPGPGTIEHAYTISFTMSALNSKTGRVAISEDYVALRDEIFQSIT